VVVLAPDTKSIDERIALLGPVAVFIDFSADQSAAAIQLHQRLKRDWPTLPVLATGVSAEPAAMLAPCERAWTTSSTWPRRPQMP
jgi:pilus assembly protein CpaE